MERDEGNLFVLEGVIIALLLMGAAYSMGSLSASSLDQERPRQGLGKIAGDALTVLHGLDAGNGSLLDVYLREQLHCSYDAAPSPLQCDGERARNLSLRLDHYLPAGGGWAVTMSNGLAAREVYASPLPGREAVASALTFSPGWNGTFVSTDLSCYDAGMDVVATLVPIERGRVVEPTIAKASAQALEVDAVAAATPGWWEATFPAATRPAASDILTNVRTDAPIPGAGTYGQCALNGKGDTLVEKLRLGTFAPQSPKVALGGSVRFDVDLTALLDVPGLSLAQALVTVYEPVGPRLNETGTWIPAAQLEVSGGVADWTPAMHNPYGTHVALLTLSYELDGTPLELRRLATVDVALPTGEVPIHAPYRVSLRVWMADWG